MDSASARVGVRGSASKPEEATRVQIAGCTGREPGGILQAWNTRRTTTIRTNTPTAARIRRSNTKGTSTISTMATFTSCTATTSTNTSSSCQRQIPTSALKRMLAMATTSAISIQRVAGTKRCHMPLTPITSFGDTCTMRTSRIATITEHSRTHNDGVSERCPFRHS